LVGVLYPTLYFVLLKYTTWFTQDTAALIIGTIAATVWVAGASTITPTTTTTIATTTTQQQQQHQQQFTLLLFVLLFLLEFLRWASPAFNNFYISTFGSLLRKEENHRYISFIIIYITYIIYICLEFVEWLIIN